MGIFNGTLLDESFVVMAATGDLSNERVLTGTTDQLVVTDNGAGSTVVLSLPQNIATDSAPTFGGLTVTTALAFFGGATLTSISTGAADNDALVTKGYVDDNAGQDPGGSDTQVQFNDSTAFGGDAGLTYSKTTDTLSGVNAVLTTQLTLFAGTPFTAISTGAADNDTIPTKGYVDDAATPAAGSDTQLQYNDGGAFGGAASIIYVDATGLTGFNVAGPAARVEINEATATRPALIVQTTDDDATELLADFQDSVGASVISIAADGSLNLLDTTSATTGVIYKDSDRFLHTFHHPTGGSSVPIGLNLFIGKRAGNFTIGSTATSPVHGSYNIGIGYRTLEDLTLGRTNVAIAYLAGMNITTGTFNVAVGSSSLIVCTTGGGNMAIGSQALSQTTGSFNVAVGVNAGMGTGGTGGYHGNVCIGYETGYRISSGDYNVLIGYRSGREMTNGDRNIVIGHYIDAQSNTADGQLTIGNVIFGTGINTTSTTVSTTGKIGILEPAPASRLEVAGGLGLAIETVTAASDTLDDTHSTVLCDCTSNAITINLPAAASSTRKIYTIKKIDATGNAVDFGSANIDGSTSRTLSSQWESITIHCNGTAWFIL